jgi:hypothetical protein
MPIIATAGEVTTRTPAPEGAHQAVCVDVIDKGMQPNKFRDGALQRKIDIAWQIDELRDDGKRFVVYKRYTLSLHEKALLRHDLESWRGKPFTPAELAGFDVEKLIGANAIINVQHKPSADKTRTYANVVSVMPLMKGMPKLTALDYARAPIQADSSQPSDEPPPPSDEDFDVVPF